MSGFDDYINSVGSFWGANGMKKPNQDNSNAQGGLNQGQNAYAGMTAPNLEKVTPERATASDAGPSAMEGVESNPAAMQTQSAQMAALSNLAANGGRNAASDANLAEIQQREGAQAAGQRGAIQQSMAARGMGGSGAALLAQLSANQGAQNNQSAEDLGVRGQEANTALQAGQGAAAIGSNMENQEFGEQAAKAQAADAINRFNSGQNTQVSEYNAGTGNQAQEYNSNLGQTEFGDKMGIASGSQKGGELGEDYYANKYKEDQQANGSLLGGLMKVGSGAIAAAAARGGEVPGTPTVPGDSPLNDKVPIWTSPKEVVVPVTVRNGSPDKIVDFVKHPPKIGSTPSPDKNKEAMLSALKRLGRK